MPGDTIKAKYLVATSTCTAAAPVRDNHGGLYLLTAGHCVNGKLGEIVGQPIYHNQKLIGHVRSAQFEIADYAVIKLQSNVKVGHNDVPHFAYLGQVSPDSQICFHGTKSGVRCGKVNRENEITYMRGAFVPGIVIGTLLPCAPSPEIPAPLSTQTKVSLVFSPVVVTALPHTFPLNLSTVEPVEPYPDSVLPTRIFTGLMDEIPQ